TVTVGADRSVTIYNFNGNTDVIFDVQGYYLPGAGTTGLYNPVTPTRLADTRSSTPGTYQGRTLGSNSTLDIAITGQGPVPASGVSAVALNVTAAPTGQTVPGGFFTVYPKPSTSAGPPTSSSLNFGPGPAIPNRVIVKLGSGGAIRVYNFNGGNDLLVDVVGWFTDGTGAQTGGGYVPIAPARIIDTRHGAQGGALGNAAVRPLTVVGFAGIPPEAMAVVLNTTVTDTTLDGGFLTAYPDANAGNGSPPPNSSDLNFGPNTTRANLVVVQVGQAGAVDIYNFNGSTNVIADVEGWFE
ncbi:MAG: hypothetical protein ACYDGR_09065, partial [Candidatus Dormibacteria bacterium]